MERFPITDFNRGIISRGDAEDIPDNAASDSNNVDGDAPEGILMGIPASTTKANSNNLAQASRLFAWIKTKDSKWNLVHCNGTNASGYLNVMADFYATTPTEIFGATDIASTATSMVEHGEEVRVANGLASGIPTAPKWIGYCDWTHFGGSTIGFQYDSTVLSRPAHTTDFVIDTVGSGTTGSFDVAKIYEYTLSAVYDGVQESPLGTVNTTDGKGRLQGKTTTGAFTTITVTVTINGYAGINNRITAYKLYRRELDVSGTPLGLYRLMQTFDVTSATAYTGVNWGTVTTTKTVVYADTDSADSPDSYEGETGIAETLTSSDVYYSLNTDLNGFHFVAGCAKTGLPEASMMMFRSKQYRYDMFNWTNDYLKLPTVPTALKAFGGKIWAFDENNMYRINPDGMYIEDTTAGIGCLSQRSITITDYVMFWCDYKNAYWHDGTQIVPIGDAIRGEISSTLDWTGFTKGYTVGLQGLTPIVVFHSPKNYILFIVPDHTGVVSNVWAFQVQKKRWDCWRSFTQCGVSTTGFGAFSGKNGEVYVSTGVPTGYAGLLVEPLGAATWRSFYWTSKVLDFGQPFRLKRINEINTEKTSTTSAPAVTVSFDRSGSFASFSAITQCKLLQLKITEATGYGNKVYSTEILLRRLAEL